MDWLENATPDLSFLPFVFLATERSNTDGFSIATWELVVHFRLLVQNLPQYICAVRNGTSECAYFVSNEITFFFEAGTTRVHLCVSRTQSLIVKRMWHKAEFEGHQKVVIFVAAKW